MAKVSAWLALALGVVACGAQPTWLSKRQLQDEEKPPTFSAWNCPDDTRQSLSFADVARSTTPTWMLALTGDQGLSDVKADIWRYAEGRRVKHAALRYRRNDVPLCRVYGRADEIDGQRFTDVQAPNVDAFEIASQEWGDDGASAATVLESLFAGAELISMRADKCWWDDDGRLFPAWDVAISSTAGPVHGFADAQRLYAAAPRAFELDGVARIHDKNINGARTEVPLYGLDGSGYLHGPRFETVLPSGAAVARNTEGRFIVPSDDPTFAEISIYANAELMVEWLSQAGAKSAFGCVPIEIHPHSVFGGDVNNGFYTPVSDGGRPAIFLGDGDGKVLQNLATDMEAVSHEIGHHVVYRSVTDTRDTTSVIIHEALADFFVFARTGEPCLGETLCPATSTECSMPLQCLRTADNDMSFTDTDLPAERHKRSQVLSGMLWDIGQAIGLDNAAALALGSIDYLLPRSTFRDFVVALMLADADANDGKNACLVLEQAVIRGLGEHLDGLNCTDYQR